MYMYEISLKCMFFKINKLRDNQHEFVVFYLYLRGDLSLFT